MSNWLENAIAWVNPEWACRRYAYRNALELARNYDAASSVRPNNTWRGINTSGEQANAGYREILRGNAQDMERNSDETNALILALERNVIGVGPRLQAKVRKADGSLDEATNQRLEEDWRLWCKPRNCDVTGQQSFAEQLRMGVRRRLVDGAAIWLKVYDGGASGSFLPFTLQPKEVYDLDTSLVGMRNGNLVVAGIELNSYNRPLAYWFKQVSADGFYTGESTRIEANRVIFWWNRLRPSQIREITLLAPSLTRLKDVREYIETVSIKEKIAACFAMFINRGMPMSGAGRGAQDPTSGYYQKTMSPGMIIEGQTGDTATAIQPPANSAANARDFAGMMERMVGAGQGLSYEVLSRDVSQANYSSARLNRLEDEGTYDMIFDSLDAHVLDEVYPEFVISDYLAGRFPVADFWRNKGNYLSHAFIAPGLPWVDPLKEAQAGTEAMQTGQESILNLCSARGLDAREVAEQNAQLEVYAELVRKDAYEKAGMTYPGPKAAPAKATTTEPQAAQ